MSALLEARRLNKRFGGLAVARDVSLALAPGDRVALIGPNGAGKTTFVDLATGALAPDSGVILLGGADVTGLSVAERARRGLARSFQVTRLFPDMTALEHLALAILQRDGRAMRLFADYRAMPDVVDEARDLLARLGLGHLANRPVAEIAYGQQRLVELALALALRPKVLLLDEPAAGVSHGDLARIEQAIAGLPAELAVLMIDHDIDLVFRFARRVVVMASGEIVFDGAPADAIRDAKVREAYLGSYADARGAA